MPVMVAGKGKKVKVGIDAAIDYELRDVMSQVDVAVDVVAKTRTAQRIRKKVRARTIARTRARTKRKVRRVEKQVEDVSHDIGIAEDIATKIGEKVRERERQRMKVRARARLGMPDMLPPEFIDVPRFRFEFRDVFPLVEDVGEIRLYRIGKDVERARRAKTRKATYVPSMGAIMLDIESDIDNVDEKISTGIELRPIPKRKKKVRKR